MKQPGDHEVNSYINKRMLDFANLQGIVRTANNEDEFLKFENQDGAKQKTTDPALMFSGKD